MNDDKKMIELLADMLIKLDKLDAVAAGLTSVAERVGAVESQQIKMATEQIKTTNAIISLTALLQKALIEPAEQQGREIADIKERLQRLEQAIEH